jgi:hypothetical protein
LTWVFYPRDALLSRYDFLTLAALIIQCVLIATRLESRDEAKVILMFHLVGTVMEVFKTSVGSWVYPEASFLRLGGVPLFSGFMYASIGSYIARAWRLFEFRFTHHPSFAATVWLAMAIYANFFTHHFFLMRDGCYSLRWPCCSGAHGSIFESGACTGACRCCWVLYWWRRSSGLRRTSARLRRRGVILRSVMHGAWCRYRNWVHGCC